MMFGMVAANGILVLGQIDFAVNRKRLYVVAVGLAVGLIPNVNPHFFDRLPAQAAAYLHNGVMLGIIATILLNLALDASSLAWRPSRRAPAAPAGQVP